MSLAPLLQRFVDDELGRAPALVSRVLAGTLQLLREGKDGLAAAERTHHIELIAALQKQGDLYQSSFIEGLRAVVAEGSQRNGAEWSADSKSSFGGLQLVDETLADVDIEISRAIQLIDTTAEWELRELQTFTSTLVGQSHISSDSNPLRPQAYATALWQAACAVATAQVQRTTLLRHSSGVAAGLLKNAWAAASTRLEAQGIEPGVYRTVVFAGSPGSTRPSAVDVTRPGALGGLLSRMPGGSPGEARLGSAQGGGAQGGAPGAGGSTSRGSRSVLAQGPEFEEVLLRLDELLRHLPVGTADGAPQQPLGSAARLGHHRSALVASVQEAGDRQVIELLSRIFETVLSDPVMPAAFRPVIARMQVAALRVAMQEPSMMDSHNHAVWYLMDRIGEASLVYSQPEDPRLAGLQSFCYSVVEEIARTPAPDGALFRRAMNRIDSFLHEQMQVQLRAASPTVAALEMAERRNILEQRLSQKLTDQMVAVRTTPGVRRFVTGAWAKVLAEAMLRFGEDAEPTELYLKTVDDLLWSLQIPDHPQSRQRLLAMLPVLLQRLRGGMELVALPRPEQQAVLDELMTIHAEALRPGNRNTTAALTPDAIVKRIRDEVVSDAAGPRPFSDSVIDLSSMDTVPAEVLPTGGQTDDEAAQRVEGLRAGQRLRLFVNGRWSPCQLLWRSDQGHFFLFAGDTLARTHSITRRALERLSTAGLIADLQPKPLLQRAVDQLMREISPRAEPVRA